LLPDNDFKDNNPAKFPAKRFRPYLRKQDGGFELYYPVPFKKQTHRTLRLSPDRKRRNRILNAWQTAHLVRQIDFSGVERYFKAKTRDSAYDTYSAADLEVLLFSYERILEKAHPRPVTFFIIPRDEDFLAYAGGRHDGRIAEALRGFDKDRERVAIVDLMPAFQAYMREHGVSHEAFFLDFDPHWSPLGHRVAAAAALASLRASSPESWPDPALFFPSP
jgi:hypothetical protein